MQTRSLAPRFVAIVAALLLASEPAAAPTQAPDIRRFFQAASLDEDEAEAALEALAEGWRDGHAALLVDIARFFPSARRRTSTLSRDVFRDDPVIPGLDPASEDLPFERVSDVGEPAAPAFMSPQARVRARLVRFLEKQTGERFGDDLRKWRKWLWNRPYEPHPDYALFKAVLYSQIDERMSAFFTPGKRSSIRLDEVDWGGVRVNGIPPLDRPKQVPGSEAEYLDDDDIVFGMAINGEARAYPKRILAWHELARDEVGGVDLAIVYCTLCGTVIPYGAEVGGRHRTFGTSGLLYRSNKLMFDEETMSLWSTMEGRPVVGELAGTELELETYPVVTTTWEEWRAIHPDSLVLSIDTGYERDYSEGAAYRDYFRTDRLMFDVPEIDSRLKNKDEVLAILLRPKGSASPEERKALALSAKFLEKNRLHHVDFAGYNLVVVTSPEGANRVYDAAQYRFGKLTKDGTLMATGGSRWRLTEDALVRADGPGEVLPRVAARRAFWFGWYAQFPETRLVR